ncbi:MAG TPA: peroxiredoxin [bacterium]|nr:peroxiredoxin [bacterium]
MKLHLGDKVPDFKQESTQGPIRFYDWAGDSWVVFFSHPADFTPVCTTELGMAARMEDEFTKRKTKLLALSVDPLVRHREWIQDIEQTQGAQVRFPILADKERKVAELYDMIHPEVLASATVRTVFFIDPEKRLRAHLTYPASTGRDFDELLRVLDSLQLTDQHLVATPVNWKRGEDVVILPTLTDEEEIRRRFPMGYRKVRPYLRLTPQPDMALSRDGPPD